MNVFYVIQLSTGTDEIDNHRKPTLTMKKYETLSSSVLRYLLINEAIDFVMKPYSCDLQDCTVMERMIQVNEQVNDTIDTVYNVFSFWLFQIRWRWNHITVGWYNHPYKNSGELVVHVSRPENVWKAIPVNLWQFYFHHDLFLYLVNCSLSLQMTNNTFKKRNEKKWRKTQSARTFHVYLMILRQTRVETRQKSLRICRLPYVNNEIPTRWIMRMDF